MTGLFGREDERRGRLHFIIMITILSLDKGMRRASRRFFFEMDKTPSGRKNTSAM
jgi:hypothetical protein